MAEARIAERYRVERRLGEGGMARVFEVTDERSGERLALKQLLRRESDGHAAIAAFQREYQALTQLSHPLIIRVFDYGTDEEMPFYTMELLSGSTLHALAPLEWAQACALLRDVASALAMLHSRRLVHRDVSPRNVCRGEDGHAKLIDFGALMPMGHTRDVVGTPPFTPPEAIEAQILDARSDLFSLGALAYYLLTGRHAFPARRMAELVELWAQPLRSPAALGLPVPPALDELITRMLSVNPLARPASAAEVFDRLTAIADLPAVEAPEIAQAYLTSPALIGRAEPLARFRRRLQRLEHGHGLMCAIEGKSGYGRSRLLASCLLEAKLKGFPTLRVDGAQDRATPFAAARALERTLREMHAAACEGVSGDDLAQFITTVASKARLVIGIDDFDRWDAASQSTLLQVAEHAFEESLGLLLCLERGASGSFAQRARRIGTSIRLHALSSTETRHFVSSLFGDVPNVDVVAEWMYPLAEGNPRTSLELAQHLVDHKIARYEEGSWVLPSSVIGLGLPETLDQASADRIDRLSLAARTLAETLALVTEHDPLYLDEFPALTDDPATLYVTLAELTAASILVPYGDTYTIAHRQLRQVITRAITSERTLELHRKIARAYDSVRTGSGILVAYHLFQGEERAAAVARLSASENERTGTTFRGQAFGRSAEAVRLVESMFEWGRAQPLPRRQLVLIGRIVLQLASVTDIRLGRYTDQVLEPLLQDSGLADYARAADIADPEQRIRQCVGNATARYQALPEHERGLAPLAAINELAATASAISGVCSRALDADKAREVAELFAPLAALSPALSIVADVLAMTLAALRGEFVRERRVKLLEKLRQPVSGLDDATRNGTLLTNLYYQALEEGSQGYAAAAVEGLKPLDGYPHFAPLAWQARMILHLFQGEEELARQAQKERDRLGVGRPDIDQHFQTSALYEALVATILGDLMALKRCLPVLADRARNSAGWRAYHHVHVGNYYALRGELEKALREQELAYELVPHPGRHAAWVTVVGWLTHTLLEAGNAERAAEILDRALAESADLPLLPLSRAFLEINAARAAAALGRGSEAVERARRLIESCEQNGMSGVGLAELYARQAKLALDVGVEDAFDAGVERLRRLNAGHKSTALATKHAKLVRRAEVTQVERELFRAELAHTTMIANVRARVGQCRGSVDRAAQVLSLLLDHAGVGEGFLYLCNGDGFSLAASTSELAPPEWLEADLEHWARTANALETTATVTLDRGGKTVTNRDFEYVEISARRGGDPLLAGVLVFTRSQNGTRIIPAGVLGVLAEELLAAGDVTGWASPPRDLTC